MELLFLTDEFPPHDQGGYSQLCYDCAAAIRAKGHSVSVLCVESTIEESKEEHVNRSLKIPVHWGGPWPVPFQQFFLARQRVRSNISQFEKIVESSLPDGILIWPTGYVDPHLMKESEHLPRIATAYYLAGVSPTDPSIVEQYWENPGRSQLARLFKSLLRPFLVFNRDISTQLHLEHVMCVSEYEQRRIIAAGVLEENTQVVHNGIDLLNFDFLGLPSTRRGKVEPLNVLYSGRLVEDKGAKILVQAMGMLRRDWPHHQFRVTLLGSGPAEYTAEIDRLIREQNLDDCVTRRDWIDRSEVPSFMSSYDVLVLPTIRPEALSRSVQEAMAMGLVVVATPTGGTTEIVKDQETGLIFPKNDAGKLANCLAQLHNDLALCDLLVSNALDLVKNEFTIDAMADTILMNFHAWLDQIPTMHEDYEH